MFQPPTNQMDEQNHPIEHNEEQHDVELWECQFCRVYNQFCVKYACQMFILSGVIITSLIKLSGDTTDNRDFWSSLLSFALGVIVPNPSPNLKH